MDGQSTLASLSKDGSMDSKGIQLQVGHSHNIDKKGTAEKAVRELREQVVRLSPRGGPVSELTLARATASLHSLISSC